LLSISFMGCGAATGRSRPIKDQELVVESPTTVVTATAVTDVETLLYEAQLELDQGRYQSAADRFELVVNSAQKPQERLRGLLGWGTALDAMGRPRQALAVYGRYEVEAQEGPQRDEVRVRELRIYTYLEDYQRAAETAGRVSTEQAPLAQIAIQASLALFALSQDRLEDAELAIGRV
jgi:tetratricopeptide (TPR) repeat protein